VVVGGAGPQDVLAGRREQAVRDVSAWVPVRAPHLLDELPVGRSFVLA
jgi:hypothetical protein